MKAAICRWGGLFRGRQIRSPSPGNVPIRVDTVDPVTRLVGLPPGWTNRSVALEATADDDLSGMAPAADGAPFTAIRIDSAPPVLTPGDSVTATVVAAGFEGEKEPFDAFWGHRYAQLRDPDGVPVDLYAPLS